MNAPRPPLSTPMPLRVAFYRALFRATLLASWDAVPPEETGWVSRRKR